MSSFLRATLAGLLLVFVAVATPAAQRSTPGVPVVAGPPTKGPIHFQFAIYYLVRPSADILGTLRSRLAAHAGSPKLLAKAPPPTSVLEPVVMATWNTTSVQKEYQPPGMEQLLRFGRGLTREQAESLQRSEQALILDFVHPASHARSALAKALEITLQIARDSNGLVWDEETREVFTPDEWQKRRLDSWENGLPDVSQHTVIHAYRSDNLVRAISLGMAKFGLPDIVVSDFSWSMNRPIGHLISLFSQALVEGATISRAGQYDLDLRTLKHAGARDPQLKSVKTNASAVAKLTLVNGKWEAGDPDNRLFEIRFDRNQGADRYAQQTALLTSAFGADQDAVTRLRHNEELLAASKAAQSQLPKLRDAFNKGLRPGEYILVKAPFTTSGGGTEWMWVEVTRWSGDAIEGLLRNQPVDVPGVHGGQMVKVSQEKVFDYARRHPDGREDGNETTKIIARMQGTQK